ncbi:MAG: site-2 protease family protein [Planctomycetota bacterium]
MILGEPPRSQWDLQFALFGIPVRVHPFFWVVALVLGFNASPQLIDLVVWVAAVFVAILVHELGHAMVMRAYGFSPSITLYGMGGLASYGQGQAHGSRGPDTFGQILISAAGPGAGFVLAGAIVGLLVAIGVEVGVFLIGGFLPYVIVGTVGSAPLTHFIQYVLFVCTFWGFINLLPVYPLDGGHIARELLLRANPHAGIAQSLMLSVITGIGVAVISLVSLGDIYIAILFGFLAYSSYAALQAYRGRGPW